MWDDIMKYTAASGLNTIDTYVFWHLHEPTKGTFDWSGNLDLMQFLKTAQKYNLDVILRIGPYICAEINYGGFPVWLKEIEGIQFRTYNQPFMKEMGEWVSRVVDYVKPQLSINGGNVILLQIENEYGDQQWAHGDLGKKYLQWCIDFADSLKPGVPCQGSAGSALNTVNGFYGHERLGEHWRLYPDQPGVWTENWPGWFDFWNYNHNTRSTQDVVYSVLRFFAMGGTGMNYYMWHGGTNFGRTPSYLVTTGYDYDAPLDEYGHPHNPKYSQLSLINLLLKQHQDFLISNEWKGKRPEAVPLGEKVFAYQHIYLHSSIDFLCNDNDKATNVTYRGQEYKLNAKSVLWLRFVQGQVPMVVIDSSDIQFEPSTQTFTPLPSPPTQIKFYTEPNAPFDSKDVIKSKSPLESIQFTKDLTDYTWYVTTVKFDDKDPASKLVISRMGDIAHLFVNDSYVSSSSFYLSGNRGKYDSDGWKQQIDIAKPLTPGNVYKIAILTAVVGLTKIEGEIAGDNLADDKRGIWGKVTLGNKDITDNGWSIQPGTAGEYHQIYSNDGYSKVEWSDRLDQALRKPLTWYSLSFNTPQNLQAPLVLDVSGLSKGIAWVNGKCLGRYSNLPTKVMNFKQRPPWMEPVMVEPSNGGPTQRYYHIPRDWLNGDSNRVVLFEELGAKIDEVRLATVSYRYIGHRF
ncbi:beta galactosidase [Acrasis kona]|uniref:beta-galactosidase n=1 Tax=Acrasis kona TaxID=1008807 RepID=A0AAW2ZBI5_9EUKA